jgi:hypothetical protein
MEGVLYWVKTHYSRQKMLSQMPFFKIVQLSTSTKPILKEFFINYIQNKVFQFPNNKISKEITFLINVK